MACTQNIPPSNCDSEMEEGEIIDELDDMSDISSEEEFLLRERLQVLENYNNVLERKKAKTSNIKPGKTEKCVDLLPQDLSEISGTDDEISFPKIPKITVTRNNNGRHIKQKKRKDPLIVNFGKCKEVKKKPRNKKKLPPKVVKDSSDESDDEYRNKRRKLANAVIVNTHKTDNTSLSARLQKMFGTQSHEPLKIVTEKPPLEQVTSKSLNSEKRLDSSDEINPELHPEVIHKQKIKEKENDKTIIGDLIDLCDEDPLVVVHNVANGHNIVNSDMVDGVMKISDVVAKKPSSGDSDEDLELLRQHALKTKVVKTKSDQTQEPKLQVENKPSGLSEDEDSDTAELRLICLKSALLKKAIEMKQKQKMRKRLSQSQSIQDEFDLSPEKTFNKADSENNTDIESVDMDIGSDGDDKLKEIPGHTNIIEDISQNIYIPGGLNIANSKVKLTSPQKDEIDEDEDLLRAKLLTSLSKNWPNLVDPNVVEDNIPNVPSPEVSNPTLKTKTVLPEQKPLIINLGESDSEGEHEATKNLTKMHIKLSEQVDFQQKLDLFLKSTRLEVEKQTLPDVVQQPVEQPKPIPKFVPKTVRHLPKSEQIEYKNLVKRMAELEKLKQARQTSVNLTKTSAQFKDTLKPRNISIDTPKNNSKNNLEEQIAFSRKKIAEESANMLKLKEEAKKLIQKYKIVSTELRNISTAITLNKKGQRSVQNRLTKIRLQHQTLIKSSPHSHSKPNVPLVSYTNKIISLPKLQKENNPSKDEYKSQQILQKENNPSKDEYKNQQILKSMKVSVVNDLKNESANHQRLSVQVDVVSNKKVIKLPKSPTKDRVIDVSIQEVAETDDRIFTKKRRKSKDLELIKNSDKTEKTYDENHDNNSPLEASVAICEEQEKICKNLELNKSSDSIGKSNDVNHDYKSPLEANVPMRGHKRKNSMELETNRNGDCLKNSNDEKHDYKSPLEALQSGNWQEDPNSILCPFEVGGTCKDSACKYLHPKIPSVH